VLKPAGARFGRGLKFVSHAAAAHAPQPDASTGAGARARELAVLPLQVPARLRRPL
jgi:hypothetical protein